jgi:adenylate cyclase
VKLALEIERKFLVKDYSWRASVTRSRHIEDHLIAKFENGKARIRVCESEITLTIKGPRRGFSRREYHVALSEDDGRSMIKDFAKGPGLEKMRHDVLIGDLLWQVDEYLGHLRGLVTADVELANEEQSFIEPSWVGMEITGDTRFSSSVLAKAVELGEPATSQLLASSASPPR